MARPTPEDLDRYTAVLTQIGERLRLARQLLDQPVQQATWIAAELRIVLELIVLGSLVTNRNAISRVSHVLKIGDDVTAARKLVREVNPRYWPLPVESGPRQADGAQFAQPANVAYLREDEWGREHGFLSDLLHAQSPYAALRDAAADTERLTGLYYRIALLLRQHWIVLAGDRDSYLGQLDVDGGQVLVATLRRPEEGGQ